VDDLAFLEWRKMSRILVAAIPAPGHVNPMLAVAEALRDRGHEVLFYTGELFRERIEAARLPFIPYPSEADFDHHDPIAAEPSVKDLPASEVPLAIFARLCGGRIPCLDRSLRSIVAMEKIDAILHDVLFMGALPMLLRNEPRPAIVNFGVCAPMWLDPGASITSGYSKAPGWRERNISENEKVSERRSSFWRYVDEVLANTGTRISGGFHDNLFYRLPDVTLQFGAEAIEFPLEEPKGNVVFVGPPPSKNDAGKPKIEWLKTRDHSKPLIFVTQGTAANRNLDQLLQPAIEGLANEDVEILATTGGTSTDRLIPDSNAHVATYVPYEDVLPETAVFVTNGGYNGVMEALSFGVPIIVAGTTQDKPRVGHRVEWSGVGINLKTATPTKEQVRDAVKEILSNPSYRERAKTVQATFSQMDSVGIIAKQIDTAILSRTLDKPIYTE
jgi:MGT family glycosyltransferase